MNKVSIGVLLCLSGLILLHWNQAFAGVPVFMAGILVMNGGSWRRK
ncbi:hypothetical protein [Desulforhopalus sp. IMCC35007]|nr:hypothetical protein [Desulforhopalus sp. IMCC35007]